MDISRGCANGETIRGRVRCCCRILFRRVSIQQTLVRQMVLDPRPEKLLFCPCKRIITAIISLHRPCPWVDREGGEGNDRNVIIPPDFARTTDSRDNVLLQSRVLKFAFSSIVYRDTHQLVVSSSINVFALLKLVCSNGNPFFARFIQKNI